MSEDAPSDPRPDEDDADATPESGGPAAEDAPPQSEVETQAVPAIALGSPPTTPLQSEVETQVGSALGPPVVPPPPDSGGVDAVGVLAHVLFIAIGGLLVFGFAYALWPAVEVQNDGPCRALRPNALAYTPSGLALGDGVEGEGLPEVEIRPAPDLQLERLDGSPVSLSDYAGKFVVLNFWASWCEPCLREWPELDKLARRLSDNDEVVILAVSLDHQLEDIEPYLSQAGLGDTPVEVVFDRSGKANEQFGSQALPDTFFIDREGQLIGAFVNVREWGKPHAYRCVEATARR